MNLPPSLQRRLLALSCGLRLLRAARGLALWAAGCAVSLALVVLVLGFCTPSAQAHAWLTRGLWAVGSTSLVAVLLWSLLVPAGVVCVGRELERRFPDLQDGLLALLNPAPSHRSVASLALAKALLQQVSARLADEKLVSALDLGALRRAAMAALGGALVAGLIIVFSPQGVARLLSPPARVLQPPAPVRAALEQTPRKPAQAGIYDLAVTLTPPEYSGQAGQTLTHGFEKLSVLRGTVVAIGARVTPGARATLSSDSAEAQVLRVERGSIQYTFTATVTTDWTLSARLGRSSAASGPHRVAVVADRSPVVRIVRPGRDLSVDQPDPVSLAVVASDDFGLGQVSLHYRRQGDRTWRSLPLGEGGRELASSSEWDLSPMGLRPGDAVEYRAVAMDNDTIVGPKTAVSRTYSISLRKQEVRAAGPRAVAEAQAETQGALERLQAEAEAFDRQIEDLLHAARDAQASGEAPQVPRGALQEAQERLQARAQDARQAMAEAEQSLAQNPLVSDDMLQKVQELHRLMAEVLDKDMQAVMDRLNQAIEKLGTPDFPQSMEDLQRAQQAFRDKLDRTLSLLRKAKLEAELQALGRHAQDLADRQDELGRRTEKLAEGDRVDADIRRQRDLAQEAEELPEQIRKVAGDMEQESPELAADLRNLAADLEAADVPGEMRRAAAGMDQGKPSSARPPQSAAAAELRDAAGRLAGAAADLTAEERKAMTGAAQKLARDALSLSRDQEQLAGKSLAAAGQYPPDLIGRKDLLTDLKRRQEAVRKGTEALAGQLWTLARQTPTVDPELPRRAVELAGRMAQTAHQIEAGQTAVAAGAATGAMTGLNDLAEDLMKLAGQMDKTTAQMALQEHLQRLEQLAQRQQALNQQSGGEQAAGEQAGGQQSGGQGQGAQGGAQPSPGGASAAQLAMEQAMIRQALEKLMKGKGGGKLADQLGGVPGAMEKVEDALKGGKVSAETRQQQREILHKMLDAQRSLYSKQKESKERKAEAPKAYKPPKAPPVLRPDQTQPPRVDRQRRDTGTPELPLDFEAVTREYLEKVRR